MKMKEGYNNKLPEGIYCKEENGLFKILYDDEIWKPEIITEGELKKRQFIGFKLKKKEGK